MRDAAKPVSFRFVDLLIPRIFAFLHTRLAVVAAACVAILHRQNFGCEGMSHGGVMPLPVAVVA